MKILNFGPGREFESKFHARTRAIQTRYIVYLTRLYFLALKMKIIYSFIAFYLWLNMYDKKYTGV